MGTKCKIAVLGSPAVGKSALVVRFLTKRFIWEYDPTLEFTYPCSCQVDDEPVAMEILDTAGQVESNQTNFEGTVRWADAFILVFSVTDRHTFKQISILKNQIDEIKRSKNVSCVIIGNKIDLEHQRQVGTAEAERMAADCATAYFETSACDGSPEIDEAFHEVYREVKRRRYLDSRGGRRRSSAQQVRHVLNNFLTKIHT
ncbi:unnamed protein product [Owenia fusiformis]|uniref:small monomeric GTPase n=1 Tax=Owenia fusiformis TaxID=6347 RepID=A0A8J1TYX0_OWEFU|nr:unnamed protein product [Owenia fusiformis]